MATSSPRSVDTRMASTSRWVNVAVAGRPVSGSAEATRSAQQVATEGRSLYQGDRMSWAREEDGTGLFERDVFAYQAAKRLAILNAAPSLDTLRALPSNRLEALRGDRAGQFSIRINQQWRICFEWPESQPGPTNVEIVDYH